MINEAFFKKMFLDYRWRILLFGLIVALYGILIVGFYPVIQERAEEFGKLLELYPSALKEAFGISSSSPESAEGFLSAQYFSFTWVIILSILIFSLGASMVAGEVEKGTSEFSFSLPIERRKIVLSKFIAAYFISLLVILITLTSIVLRIYTIDVIPHLKGFTAFFILASALSFFLLALTTFFSSIFEDKSKIYGAAAGFFSLSYIAHVLNGISDKAAGFYSLSFFKYYGRPEAALTSGRIEIENIAIFFLIGLILLLFSLIISEKRDLSR